MTATNDQFDHYQVFDQEQGPLIENLAEIRSSCPVQHSDAHGGFWAIFGYENVGQIARDPSAFSSMGGATIPSHGFPMPLPPIESDPPRHKMYRGPMLPIFSPPAVEKLTDSMREMVTRLIDGFCTRGEADLAGELTIPFPGMTIGLIMGVPNDEIEQLKGWTRELMLDISNAPAIGEALAFFTDLYERRKAEPKDDFPSLVIGLEIDGEPISPEECLAVYAMVTFAGLETTANSSSHIFDLLSQRTDLRDELVADPTKIPTALEELLRYTSPLPASARTVSEDIDFMGEPLQAGDRVLLNWISANHDPAEFESPSEIKLDRFPNRHYVFGVGSHRCLGVHLARAQLRILVEEVLRRIPDYEVQSNEVERYIGVTRGIGRLPIKFTPTAASA